MFIKAIFLSACLLLLSPMAVQADSSAELANEQQVQQVMQELMQSHPELEYRITNSENTSKGFPVVAVIVGSAVRAGTRGIWVWVKNKLKKKVFKTLINCKAGSLACIKDKIYGLLQKVNTVHGTYHMADDVNKLWQVFTSKAGQNSFGLSIRPQRSSYRIGDSMSLAIRSDESCYLTLIDFSTTGETSVVFSSKNGGNYLRANHTKTLPFTVTNDAGTERIVGICRLDNTPVNWRQYANQNHSGDSSKGIRLESQQNSGYQEAVATTSFTIK